MFDGFSVQRIPTSGAEIHTLVGGSGPPLLLLHGYPQTHVMWHKVAPRLAADFTVVAPDLRGYGASSKPPGGDDHGGYAKRTMALDQVEVMQRLGFERFSVAGHDRGARVAYRMALDHPDRVTRLAVLDVVPTAVMFANVDRTFAMSTFHWFFLAQPFDLPERLIGGAPDHYLRAMLTRWSGDATMFAPEAMDAYLAAFCDPAMIHATCEDYRAGATLDVAHDEADRGTRRINCPVLAIWGGARSRPGQRDYLSIWQEWADDVRGGPLPCGHFLAEEAPDDTYAALRDFFTGPPPS
jgi:haloacetate dehalogenase